MSEVLEYCHLTYDVFLLVSKQDPEVTSTKNESFGEEVYIMIFHTKDSG